MDEKATQLETFNKINIMYKNIYKAIVLLTSACLLGIGSLQAQTIDISGLSPTYAPTGTTVTWHTACPPTSANQVDATMLTPNTNYFAAFYHATDDCYSIECTPVHVVCNGTTPTATNVPTGATITSHSGTPATSANEVASPMDGRFYTAFYHAVDGCYSEETSLIYFGACSPIDTDGDGNPDSTDPNPSTPTAANDTGTGNPAVGTAVAVLANDDYLANGAANNAGITTITDAGTGTAAGTVALDNTTGEITYTPTAGEAGTTVSIDYQVCNDASGSAVCATASLSFTVGDPDTDGDGNPDSTDPNSGTATAANDTGTGNPDIGTAVDILANDDYLVNGAANNAGITTITDASTGTAAGTVAIDNTTGEITYTPTAGEAGTTVSIDYQVCNDASGSAVCATASLSFTVVSLCGAGTAVPMLIKN